jgi:hypothetical protein
MDCFGRLLHLAVFSLEGGDIGFLAGAMRSAQRETKTNALDTSTEGEIGARQQEAPVELGRGALATIDLQALMEDASDAVTYTAKWLKSS